MVLEPSRDRTASAFGRMTLLQMTIHRGNTHRQSCTLPALHQRLHSCRDSGLSLLLGHGRAWENLIFLGRRFWVRPAAPQPPRCQDLVTQLVGSGALCLLNLQLILLVGRRGGVGFRKQFDHRCFCLVTVTLPAREKFPASSVQHMPAAPSSESCCALTVLKLYQWLHFTAWPGSSMLPGRCTHNAESQGCEEGPTTRPLGCSNLDILVGFLRSKFPLVCPNEAGGWDARRPPLSPSPDGTVCCSRRIPTCLPLLPPRV